MAEHSSSRVAKARERVLLRKADEEGVEVAFETGQAPFSGGEQLEKAEACFRVANAIQRASWLPYCRNTSSAS